MRYYCFVQVSEASDTISGVYKFKLVSIIFVYGHTCATIVVHAEFYLEIFVWGEAQARAYCPRSQTRKRRGENLELQTTRDTKYRAIKFLFY